MRCRAARLASTLLGLAAVLTGAPGIHAMWAKLTEAELIAQSDDRSPGYVLLGLGPSGSCPPSARTHCSNLSGAG